MAWVGYPPNLPKPGASSLFGVRQPTIGRWTLLGPSATIHGGKSHDTAENHTAENHSTAQIRRSLPIMKLIIAIIQPSKLEDVKTALSEVEVVRLTIMDVQGFGRQKGQTEVYRGREISLNLLRKVQLQIAVNDDFVEPTVEAIIRGGRTGTTGEIGDGKIFVLPLEDCIRIRTGERGTEAV